MKKILRNIKNRILFFKKIYIWRKKNKHNYICLRSTNYITLDINRVRCGKYSYGKINVEFYGDNNEGLDIGNYCSIGPNVLFLLGGNHLYNCITTYPFKTYVYNEKDASYSKGKIIIKDDVWIGAHSIILSGVTLEKGCIIGAGSVVTKDVPPYAIVAGNPATIIKYRFEKDVVEKLVNCNFNQLEYNSKMNLYTPIDKKNVDQIITLLNGESMEEKNGNCF